MSSSPFFSIILPVYNRESFIKKSIESVLDQDFKDFELIIVDDGSTDNTSKVVRGFSDNRIRYYWKKNEERNIARNFGISKAKGRYLNFLDSDDIHYSNHLSHAFKSINELKFPEIFHSNHALISGNRTTPSVIGQISSNDINKKLIDSNFLHCNTVFIKEFIFEKFKFLDSQNAIVGEDYYLWLKLASRYRINQSLIVTSAIIEHNQRSLNKINVDKLILGTHEINYSLKQDESFMNYYGWKATRLLAYNLIFLALHLAINRRKKESFNFLWLSFKTFPFSIFTKRFIGAVKTLIVN